MRKKLDNKLAQIWIETVIYTLIAFVLIGAVLAFVKPKIDEIQDKAVIEQSIGLLKDIDSIVTEITQGGAGNKRKIEISIRSGELKIDGENDEIIFELKSRHQYSEPGRDIPDGNLIVRTEEFGDFNIVTLRRIYSETHNITFDGKDEIRTLSPGATTHFLFLDNNGKSSETNKWDIDATLG